MNTERGTVERGTIERWQHSKAEIRSIEMGSGKATTEVIADRWPTVFDRLRDQGLIDDRQHDCAIWLATLRVAAGLEPRQTSSYSPLGHGGEDISDDQAERRALFNKVVRALGSDAQPVLDAIEGRYSPRDLGALKDALTALVKFRS